MGISCIWENDEYENIENYRVEVRFDIQVSIIFEIKKIHRNEKSKIQTTLPNISQHQFLAIQSQINPKYDLPFLKQWIHYHISTLGVSKFFLYEINNNNQQENQLIHCEEHTEERIQYQIQNIIQTFPEHVIYIPWSPQKISVSFPFNLFFKDKQTNSKHDYIKNYRNFVNYTIFLRTDQMIFSQMGLKLFTSIAQQQKHGYNTFIIQKKYFQSRYCNKNSYMIQNYVAFQVDNFQSNILKIFQTNSFKLKQNNEYGNIKNEKSLTFNKKQWKLNQYSLTISKLQKIKQKYHLTDIIVNQDFSAQNKKTVLKNLCKGDCFIKFTPFCINYYKTEICPNTEGYQTSY